MIKLTKNQLLVSAFAENTDVRTELNSVYCDGQKTIATDSYRMMQVTKKGETEMSEPVMVAKKYIDKLKVTKKKQEIDIDAEKFTISHDDVSYSFVPLHPHQYTYPIQSVKNILEEAKEKNKISIRINGAMFAELISAMAKISDNKITHEIVLHISNTPSNPVMITAESNTEKAEALIMPINK